MSKIPPPPTYEVIAEEDGKIKGAWLQFLDRLYTGDTGTTWTPVANSLAIVGANPTYTALYYRVGSWILFSIRIVPGTNTTSTAGTTYFSGHPFTMKNDGICFAVSGLLGSSSGMCDKTTNRIYVPGWSAVTVPLTIIGIVEAN